LDTFGGDFKELLKQMGTIPQSKTILQVLALKSNSFMYDGHSESEASFRELINRSKNKQLISQSTSICTKESLASFHALGGNLSFEKKSEPLYKIQIQGNLNRGIGLRKLAEKKGGLFFVGHSHIDMKGVRDYHFI
jgi:hypothetical protein